VAYPGAQRLAEHRALVTGASRGLGAAIARLFAAEGATVALVARDPQPLRALAEEIDAEGGQVVAVPTDVGDASAASAAVDRANDEMGGLDVVVNAAAIDCEWLATADMSAESWDRTIQINLSGTFYVCRAALRHLVGGGGGTIVNLTSVAAHRVWPEDVAYGVSKAGVEMLTRTIAVEYGRHRVRANCLAPGVIDAGMTELITREEERANLIAKHPLGRLGRANEVAEAALWLSSAASSYTTGATLVVDGGFLTG
jgi:NAD(P)-dependent dehydrogenase (short-subunit alcohol dehydrogenase family)